LVARKIDNAMALPAAVGRIIAQDVGATASDARLANPNGAAAPVTAIADSRPCDFHPKST